MSDLTRIDAIRIIENITDKDDPAWEWAVADFYDEDNDTMPCIYDVFNVLGVSEAEYKEATGAQNTKWPEVSDELYISQQVRIDSLESELSTLKAQREWVSVKERLPEKDGFYVVACRHKIGVPHLVCLNPFKVETGLFSEHKAVTHWLPLPPAPERA